MRDEPVTIIDREVLKVLSVDTRMDIIKILSEGGRTPSFVAQKLRKSDATIVEHLHALCEADLVKKTVAPGKKWVFYSLTDRGKGIVSSHSRRLVIVLATSAIAFIGGISSLFGYVYTQAFYSGFSLATSETARNVAWTPMLSTGAGDVLTETAPSVLKDTATTVGAQGGLCGAPFPIQGPDVVSFYMLTLGIFLMAVSAGALTYYLYKKSKQSERMRAK
jgi:DNA-binding transcriptional ArsR family regulator